MSLRQLLHRKQTAGVSWQVAKQVAEKWAGELPETLGGRFIQLLDFESDQDCRWFYQDRPLAFHRMISQSIGRIVRKRGGVVVTVLLSPSPALASKTPAERAKFADSLTGIR